MQSINIFDVRWDSSNAGPSPDNYKRVELFIGGCKKAREGNPCKGCFNKALWKESERLVDTKEAAKHINKFAPNKYITIVGGEPTDNYEALLDLCIELKKYDFHILVFTYHTLRWLEDNNMDELFKTIDILIDGEYDESKRIFNDHKYVDGFHNVVGSGNQVIHEFRENGEIILSYPAQDILSLELDKDNHLIVEYK